MPLIVVSSVPYFSWMMDCGVHVAYAGYDPPFFVHLNQLLAFIHHFI